MSKSAPEICKSVSRLAPAEAEARDPSLLSRLLPQPLKRHLRMMHRDHCLRSSIGAAKYHLREGTSLPDSVLGRMIYGWGNEGWSAKVNLLHALLSERFSSNSSILECGSGLSSILLGIICQQTGGRFITLEHDERWHSLVCEKLSKFGLSTDGIRLTPLRRYDDFDWYDTSSILTNGDTFDLVLCDGPPNSTRGGRYGLLPNVMHRLTDGARIIVDDTVRLDEMNMINRWLDEYRGKLDVSSRHTTFAILTVTQSGTPL